MPGVPTIAGQSPAPHQVNNPAAPTPASPPNRPESRVGSPPRLGVTCAPRPWRIACYHACSATTSGSRNLRTSRRAASTTPSAPIAPGIHASSGDPRSHAPAPGTKHSTARGSAECASCEHARMGTKSPRRGGHRTCRLTGSAQSAQRTPKNRKTAALKGEARLIDPCNASAHQGPAHGDGLRRPTGESSHRSSRHHGAASMPLDPPPGTDPPRGWPPSSPDSPPIWRSGCQASSVHGSFLAGVELMWLRLAGRSGRPRSSRRLVSLICGGWVPQDLVFVARPLSKIEHRRLTPGCSWGCRGLGVRECRDARAASSAATGCRGVGVSGDRGLLLRWDGACLREGVARRHGRRRNRVGMGA